MDRKIGSDRIDFFFIIKDWIGSDFFFGSDHPYIEVKQMR